MRGGNEGGGQSRSPRVKSGEEEKSNTRQVVVAEVGEFVCIARKDFPLAFFAS